VVDAMEKAGRAPLAMKTHWSVIKAFFGWLLEEDVLIVNPIAKASLSADAVLDRVREIVVPDFRFIDMRVIWPRYIHADSFVCVVKYAARTGGTWSGAGWRGRIEQPLERQGRV
jgi:hypothetical protein